jgi:hypothetical protein
LPAGVGPLRVPKNLGIEMRMSVDESRRHDVTFSIDLVSATQKLRAHSRNSIPNTSNIRAKGRATGSINHRSTAYNEIESHERITTTFRLSRPLVKSLRDRPPR